MRETGVHREEQSRLSVVVRFDLGRFNHLRRRRRGEGFMDGTHDRRRDGGFVSRIGGVPFRLATRIIFSHPRGDQRLSRRRGAVDELAQQQRLGTSGSQLFHVFHILHSSHPANGGSPLLQRNAANNPANTTALLVTKLIVGVQMSRSSRSTATGSVTNPL